MSAPVATATAERVKRSIGPQPGRQTLFLSTPADIATLVAEVEGMRAAKGDPESFLKHDVRFHQVMARAANNKLMSGVMDTIAQLLYAIRRQTISNARDFDEAIDWHQRIVNAMQKGDAKRAKDTLSAHLRAALREAQDECAALRRQVQRRGARLGLRVDAHLAGGQQLQRVRHL